MEAYAHRPMFAKGNNSYDTAYDVEDYELSIAIYGSLTQGTRNYYEIDGKAGDKLFCQLLVPKNESIENFTPSLAIIGPGLPKTQEKPPMELPEGYGFVMIDFEKTKDFFEPFTQTSYIMGKEVRVELPRTAKYFIEVHNNNSQGGRYALAVGEREEWGIREIIKFPIYWLRVRLWYSIWSTLLIFLAILALALYLRHKKKHT